MIFRVIKRHPAIQCKLSAQSACRPKTAMARSSSREVRIRVPTFFLWSISVGKGTGGPGPTCSTPSETASTHRSEGWIAIRAARPLAPRGTRRPWPSPVRGPESPGPSEGGSKAFWDRVLGLLGWWAGGLSELFDCWGCWV